MPTTRRPARDGSNAKGAATRDLIVKVAEEMFAEHGLTVPLRDIGTAAGQRNNIAVQYHFGDRDTLLQEIVELRAGTSDEIRNRMIADLLARGRQPDLRELVAVYVLPLATHLEEGNHYLAFLSRYVVERGGYAGLAWEPAQRRGYRSGSLEMVEELLGRHLEGCPRPVFHERWLNTMMTTVHTLARYQVLMKQGQLPAPLDDLIDDLVTCLTAALEAPVGATDANPPAPEPATNGHARRTTSRGRTS